MKTLCFTGHRPEKCEDFVQTRFGYCFYEIQNGSALIYNLYIHPEYRTKGKARRLIELVMSEIKEAGHDGEIEIEATARERGIDIDRLVEFYDSMGLKVINRELIR